ncbi:hypothetical protein CVT25_000447 [Psilocybe cyanescens]|uniref:Uncharacterized protein n=1 Tax=Psilocybe cyanescens TaxID=93625 RepID=A0A409XM01_PSICY|nr:hypothetical protein CVT25_000447 [Psilocybe cyanescens]
MKITSVSATYFAKNCFGQSTTCPDAGLAIQKEMAVQKKSIVETAVGKILLFSLKQVLLLREQVLAMEDRDLLREMEDYTEKQLQLDQLADQI